MASNRKKRKAANRNAQKRSLLQHVNSLPPELDQPIEQAINDLIDTVSATNTVSPANVNKTNVNVNVKIDDVQIKNEKREKEKELKIDKNLLKAITDLTKQFDYSNKKQKTGVAGWLGNKVAQVKNAFSIEGAAGLMGVRREDGSLKGAILGSILDKQEKAKEKAKFISNFGLFTETGRGLSGKDLVTAGEKRFNSLTKIKEQKDLLEQKYTAAKTFGGDLSQRDANRLERLKQAENIAKGIVPTKKKKEPFTREDLLAGAMSGMKEGISTATPEEQKALREMNPEILRGIFRGSLEDLVQISDDQLKQLEKIAKAAPTEEDRLESKRLETSGPIQERQAQKTNEERSGSGSLFNGIIDGLMKRIPGIASKGLKIAGTVGRGVLNVGGKIMSGAGKAIGAIGTGALSLGGKALGGIASGAGKALSGGVGAAAKGILGKLGPIAMAGMAAYDGFKGFQNASETLDIGDREATLGEKFSSAAGGIASGLTFGLLDNKTASKGIASFFGAGPSAEKTSTPSRVAQASALATQREILRKMESEERQKENAPASVVNNSPTSIVNKTTNIQRIPVRNTEPTLNNRLRQHFA